jgi:protein tyrosine/serine phosphatase
VTRYVVVFCLSVGAALAADEPGLRDFHQVNETIYRGRQPADVGFDSLAKLGIKTVVDLRGGCFHGPRERRIVEKAGMHYVTERLSGIFSPSDAAIERLMVVLNDPNAAPVFVHCRRGADRVSEVIACYRMIHDHWSNQQAYDEARSLHLSPFEVIMRHFILHFDPSRVAPMPAGS